MNGYIIKSYGIPVIGPEYEGIPVKEWTAVCHEKTFMFVHYEPLRWTSRHVSVENKKPFFVYRKGTSWSKYGAAKTFEGSVKILKEALAAINKAKEGA